MTESEEEGSTSTPKGKTKKLKGIPYSELEAMRERRRIERREEHKDRPKTKYKGLTWHTKAGKGQGQWHVQVWTGKTVRLQQGGILHIPVRDKPHNSPIS